MKGWAVGKMALAMMIFGSVGFFSEQTGIPAIELVFVRCLCAMVFLGGLWYATGKYKEEKWQRRSVMQIILCGFFLIGNWVFLFTAFGEEGASITIVTSIYHLAPVIALVLGSIVFKEKLSIFSFLAMVACLVGTILIAGEGSSISVDSLLASGIGFAFLAAICYALLMVGGKGIQGVSTYAVTFIQTSIGVVMLLPFADFDAFIGLTMTNWIYIIATGLIHTGIVYVLFFDSLRELPTSISSALVFLNPVTAILSDVFLIGFLPTWLQVAGIALIFIGMVCTFVKPRPRTIVQEKAS
ncbi:DMT family transporter [Priestia taiwanensis]|uniref:Transporter n=1 Tax=Priestia taiwanensis TaxID=1347902 RepID=A0A917AKQ4_9BACI|nr:DMT family transporter [Priestia taiwanensis]MBM7361907.1 drug/metabolite transporter (DMT)-like permease [Priestia taiwanensis]GGE57898.1 transporter [Priestia taiwanensis]